MARRGRTCGWGIGGRGSGSHLRVACNYAAQGSGQMIDCLLYNATMRMWAAGQGQTREVGPHEPQKKRGEE